MAVVHFAAVLLPGGRLSRGAKFTIDPDMSATDWRPPGRRDLRSINAGLMATIVGRRERGLGASTQANRARAGLAGA